MGKRDRSSSVKKARKRTKAEDQSENDPRIVQVDSEGNSPTQQQPDVKPKIEKKTKKMKVERSNRTIFLRKRIELAVSLLPGSLHNCKESVEDSIRGLLMKYSEGLGGILMGFENVKLIGENKGQGRGWILNELPHIHYNASCDALIFCPSIGCEVRFSSIIKKYGVLMCSRHF
jgi:hypothetical protein